MKVVIIADVLGEENNGTTTACMNLVRYLKSMGDQVSIVCCDGDKRGVPGYYVVGTYNLGPLLNPIVEKNNVSLAKPDKAVLEAAIRDADIVHVMIPFALGKAGAKIAKRMGKPITAGFHAQAENFTSHIGMMNSGLVNHLTYKVFYRNLYRNVDAIHYPTQFIRDTFEHHIHKHTKGYVISNGVHSRFVPRPEEKPQALRDQFVILFTGRYSKEKSHKILIKAVSLSRHKDQIRLIFAGQGPRRREIENYVKKCGIIPPIMKFFGKDELVKVINYSDLYCHPAEVEIEAIACLEAISCGLVPVIANSPRCATKAFALDEKNLFRCNDPQDLARKIDYWLEHPEEKAKRSEEYLGYTKQFSQQACMEAMRAMMTRCIEEKKG